MYKVKYISGTVFKYLTLVLAVLTAIIPILVVFFASLKNKTEYASTSPLSPPTNWLNFANYEKAFTNGKMLLGFGNTLIILVISVAGAVLTGAMIAYVLSRFKFRGSKILTGAFLLATLIPSVTTQVATYKIVNALHLVDTLFAPIILYLGTDIIAVYIFMQFLDTISESLDESAMLDGASYVTIFSRIILPMLAPAIVTVVILKGVGVYNDFYTPFLYMPSEHLQVISTALFKFKGPYGAQWEVISAAIIISIVPILIIFLSLQKYIYNGFAQGSEK